ncbi:MAG: TVP38/TMEM64 family protein [Oscillospiraceae bacterium]|nr:TVP38/TMEM64 family protein [Oscillospiraceae bacterium]
MPVKKYRYLLLAAIIVVFLCLTVLCWGPITAFVADPESLRQWILETGFAGVAVFGLFSILQVIFAVIPGGPFELAAGYVFGVLPGSLLCDMTMTIGSVLVFLLVRKFGMSFVELFVSRKQIESIHFLKNTQKLQSILFFIFLIPGTPKDVVTYLVGLTELPLSSWIFICFVGRFPAVLLTAMSGSALGSARYGIVAAIIVVFAICYLIGMRLYKRWNREQ